MSKKTIAKIVITAIVAALTSVLSFISCTTLVVTQKNPKDSNQKINIETSVDSTKLIVQPALNFK